MLSGVIQWGGGFTGLTKLVRGTFLFFIAWWLSLKPKRIRRRGLAQPVAISSKGVLARGENSPYDLTKVWLLRCSYHLI